MCGPKIYCFNDIHKIILSLSFLLLTDADELCTNRGCCGAGARTRLTQAARTQLESALWSELSKLADTLTNRAIKFDGKYLLLYIT